jgi:hypothetical protein
MVMPRAFRIESRGAALDGYFTHQTRLDQIPEIIISRRPGRVRIDPIQGFEDFRSRGMRETFHQECHQGVSLRSTSQPAPLEGPFNCIGVHKLDTVRSILNFV